MTPKEKAKELFNNFYDKIEDHPVQCGMYCQGGSIDRKSLAKQCALIAVDEIIQAIRATDAKSDLGYIGFWNKVKIEINNL